MLRCVERMAMTIPPRCFSVVEEGRIRHSSPTFHGQRLSRYMSLEKVLLMLSTSSVWFSRTDQFFDRFEGRIHFDALIRIAKKIEQQIKKELKAAKKKNEKPNIESRISFVVFSVVILRHFFLAFCWSSRHARASIKEKRHRPARSAGPPRQGDFRKNLGGGRSNLYSFLRVH